MNRPIEVIGAAGGVGTSVLAASIATLYARSDGKPTVLGGPDRNMLGWPIGMVVPHGEFVLHSDPVTLRVTEEHADVLDIGLREFVLGIVDDPFRVLVVQNDYRSLRAAVRMDALNAADVAVCRWDQQRSLQLDDVRDVLGRSVIAMPDMATIARAADAGVIGLRMPYELRETVEKILAHVEAGDKEKAND